MEGVRIEEEQKMPMLYNKATTGRDVKTILLRIQSEEERERLCSILSYDDYRVLIADNLLTLIEYLNNFRIDLLISEAEYPDIAMDELLSYLRRKYFDIKIIITTRKYSPELELRLRPFKLLYIMAWPVNIELLQSIIARGLEAGRVAVACACAY
jgi:DNA-binding NtrC family response regulator